MAAGGASSRRLPPHAQAVVDTYLTAVDAEAANVVEGVYLIGSIALGDFRPATSDIDFVAVTTDPPKATALAALERVHRRVQTQHARPLFDGVYVTWNQLAREPDVSDRVPRSHDGRFDMTGVGDPVTWHTLAKHGVTCKGRRPAHARDVPATMATDHR